MNNKENQQNPKDEEVDLGRFFQLIGRGFEKLFNFIGSQFVYLFHFIIVVLIFVRHHFIVLVLSLIIGGAIGFYSEDGKKPYVASMVVKPNFNSARQLYNTVQYFHDLVAQKNTVTLSKIFSISITDAALLSNFSIEPIKSNRDNLDTYNKFIKQADTTVVKQLDFKTFESKQTDFDYTYYIIKVVAHKSDIFSRLKLGILQSLESNNYLVDLKETNAQNIQTQELLINKGLVQADSLRNVYNNVMLLEAKKPFSGTNIDMAQGKNNENKDLALFNLVTNYKEQLVQVNKDKVEKRNVLDIVSDFNKVGSKMNITYRKPGNYAFMLFGLTFFVLLLLELNKFLKKKS